MRSHYSVVTAVLVVGASVLLSACSDDSRPMASGSVDDVAGQIELVALGSIEDQGIRVTLHGPEMLQSGYTPLEVELVDIATGAPIQSAQVQITPMMHLQTDDGEMNHSAPTEPPLAQASTDGCFSNPVVLIMPGSWHLHVSFAEAQGKQGTVTFDLDVEEGDRIARLTGEDGAAYFVALVAPQTAVVGRHDLELAVFRRETMMSFPPEMDLDIDMEPSMPAMGHGSPENESPLHTGAGHYTGKVNFIMTGDWRIDLTLRRQDTLIASTHFDLTVE